MSAKLFDQGNFDVLAQAIPSAIKGYQTQQALEMRKMEMQAKLDADQERRDRQSEMDELTKSRYAKQDERQASQDARQTKQDARQTKQDEYSLNRDKSQDYMKMLEKFEVPEGTTPDQAMGLMNRGLLKPRQGLLDDKELKAILTKMQIKKLAQEQEDKDIKKKEKADKKLAAKEASVKQADLVVQDMNRALEIIEGNPMASGGILGKLKDAPLVGGATDAKKLENLFDTVKSNIGFDKLQSMRQNSPTGGALGAVSDTENKMLQATLGSIKPDMDTDQLRYNLKRLLNQYNDVIHGPGNGPPRYDLKTGELIGQEKAPPATGPQGPTVIQNGHTYNWNAATGKYE